jgi:topoisomerase-4 subunit A
MSTRLTSFEEAMDDKKYKIDEIIRPFTFVFTERGWLRIFPGHEIEEQDVKLKNGDQIRYLNRLFSSDKILLFTEKGKAYTLYLNKLDFNLNDYQPIRKYINIDVDEPIVELIVDNIQNQELIVISSFGKGLICKQSSSISATRNGKKIMNFTHSGDYLKIVRHVNGTHIAILNNLGNLLVFNHTELNRISQGSGVIFQKVKDGQIIDAETFNIEEEINLKSQINKRSKLRLKDIKPYIGERGRLGKKIDLLKVSDLYFQK